MAAQKTTQFNRSTRGSKPAKPYADFPLFAHQNGQWAKKIRGRLHYFGPWVNWQAAVERYLAERDDLEAGRVPQPKIDGVTVADLVNAFLRDRRHLCDTRELAERSWHDYYLVCERVVKVFGRDRLVADLAAADFDTLRQDFAKTHGLVALAGDMTRLRVLFGFGVAHKLAPPLDYRILIKKPKAQALRRDRVQRGPRVLTADELRRIINTAGQPMKAMTLLGINCGYGNQDVATLQLTALDLKGGWAEHPRPKTGILRRAKLWPETAKALREALDQRPNPKNEKLADRLFITVKGLSWAARSKQADPSGGKPTAYEDNPVSKQFAKLLKKLKIQRKGVGFYCLRRMFETIGGGCRDQIAVDFCMGHAPDVSDMGAVYRQFVEEETDRLEAVANHVRKWLWPPGTQLATRSNPQKRNNSHKVAAKAKNGRVAVESLS